MKHCLVLLFLLVSIRAQASFDVLARYQSLGINLGRKVTDNRICGAQSKLLNSTPLAEKDAVVNCQPVADLDALMVSHRQGLPLQVSMQFKKGPSLNPMKTYGYTLLSDSTDSTGVRTIKGVLSMDQSVFTILATDGRVNSFTVTSCQTDFAEKRAKGQYESCRKSFEKAR